MNSIRQKKRNKEARVFTYDSVEVERKDGIPNESYWLGQITKCL